MSDVLDELSYGLNRDSAVEGVKLGVLLSAVGRRSYGPLLLIVGLFAISPATIVPGMTSVTALIILLIALQMAVGLKRPWLPKRVLDIRVPRRALFQFLDRARPKLERIDGWLEPRLEILSRPPFVNLVALCVAAAALVTFPLSLIPFAPLAPGIAVVLFGLGMTARDGLWLSFGVVLTAAVVLTTAPLIF
ncbi:MAG: exopolysaccharide biosynthesis protein [Hyphomonadaceae bacterium]